MSAYETPAAYYDYRLGGWVRRDGAGPVQEYDGGRRPDLPPLDVAATWPDVVILLPGRDLPDLRPPPAPDGDAA